MSEELKLSVCKCCGAKLNPLSAVAGVITCEYCGSSFTLPKDTTPERVLNFLDAAEHDLDTARFDYAYAGYMKAAELESSEPEAYFGMALSTFKVQYLNDMVNRRLQPICHEVTERKFSEDENYLTACALATPEQRAEYAKKAEEIDYILSEFYKMQQKGLDYDCFICVKVTDDDTGLRTADYKSADDIYFQLRGKGYKPFFSERELSNVTGADYEVCILYALYRAECMLVVCGNEEYLQKKWVKNEYTRFLKLVNDDEKESDSIAIAFIGRPIERLPGRKGKLQGIDLNRLGAFSHVEEFVREHTPEARKRKEEEENARRNAEEEQKRKLAEMADRQAEQQRRLEEQQRLQLEELERQKRELAEEQKRQREELESQQKKQFEELRKFQTYNSQGGANLGTLLIRANKELSFADFTAAAKYYNLVIDGDPENADAWFGLLLCEFSVLDEDALIEKLTPDILSKIKSTKYYREAIRHCDENERINQFKQRLNDPVMLLNRGDGAVEQCDYSTASKFYMAVIDIAPSNAEAWFGLMLCEFKVSNEQEILDNLTPDLLHKVKDSRNYSQAINYGGDVSRIINFDDDLTSVRALIDRADDVRMDGDFPAAAEYYKEALKIDPEVPAGWHGLLMCELEFYEDDSLFDDFSAELLGKIRDSRNFNEFIKHTESSWVQDTLTQLLDCSKEEADNCLKDIESRNKDIEKSTEEIKSIETKISVTDKNISKTKSSLMSYNKAPKIVGYKDRGSHKLTVFCVIMGVLAMGAMIGFYMYTMWKPELALWEKFWGFLPDGAVKNFIVYGITIFDPSYPGQVKFTLLSFDDFEPVNPEEFWPLFLEQEGPFMLVLSLVGSVFSGLVTGLPAGFATFIVLRLVFFILGLIFGIFRRIAYKTSSARYAKWKEEKTNLEASLKQYNGEMKGLKNRLGELNVQVSRDKSSILDLQKANRDCLSFIDRYGTPTT